MLHLQKHLCISFRQHCLFSVTRFATAASATASPDPSQFAVEDYLVASCHLTRDKALKASRALSHLKSPSKPDAVLAFLSGLGLSPPDIAAAVARYPRILCCKVDKTLALRVPELRDLDLSPTQISRLVLLSPAAFCQPAIASKLKYYILLFRSFDNVLYALKRTSFFLNCDMVRVVKPNVSLLREWGLDELGISKICRTVPRLLTCKPERLRAMVARVEGIGVPRGTPMFRHALHVLAFQREENVTAMVKFLKKTFLWSDAEVGIAVSKNPLVLSISKDRAHRVSEFLISEVGLDPEYIAHRPALIKYSLEGRLIPRHYVLKFLKANGLLEHNRCYYTAAAMSEKVFVEKFLHPYKEAAPHLAEDYAAACKGEVPSRFRLQEQGTRLASV